MRMHMHMHMHMHMCYRARPSSLVQACLPLGDPSPSPNPNPNPNPSPSPNPNPTLTLTETVTLTLALALTRRVFPWVTGYGKRSDMWSKLGYERRVVDTRTHPEKWVAWRKLKLDGVPPLQPSPTEGKWAHNFFNAQLRSPLLWLPLCSPANQSSRASVVPPAGSVEGAPPHH